MTTDEETIISNKFPQNKLQNKIYTFWRIRGYADVKAVLGNMNVSLHRDKPQYEQLGLCYQYLEQFWKEAQQEERQRIKAEWKILRKYLEDNYGMTLYSERHKVNEFEKKGFEDGN